MRGIWREAIRGLRRRRGRVALSATGIALGAAMLATATVVGFGLQTGFQRSARAADLPDIIARFNPQPFSKVRGRITALPDLAAYSFRLELTNMHLRGGGHSSGQGVVEVLDSGRRGYGLLEGREPSTQSLEAVVEQGVARSWGLHVGSRVDINGLQGLRVAGISESPDDVAYPLAVPRMYLTRAALEARFGSFGDPRVRRALSLAIDREAIAGRVLSGAYPAAHSFTPPDCGGYTARARVALDADLARRLLAEAGHPGGAGMPAIEVQVRNDEVQPPVMEAIQAMWEKELGVHVTLAVLEQKTWLQNQQTLNYAVSTSGWAGDFLDPVTFLDLFVTGGGNNWTGWGDAAYDRMIGAAASESSPQARLEVFQRAEAYLLENGPVAPLYYGAHTYLIQPAVRGWAPALLGYHRYAFVRLEN